MNQRNEEKSESKMNSASRKFAVITGGSTGIGRKLAEEFASHKYDLLLCSNEVEIVEVAHEIEAGGVTAEPVRADLATSKGVETLYAAIQAMGRPVDALVMNAGVGVGGDFVRENKLEDEINLIALNITSVVHLSKLVLPKMVARGEGRVLITSSIAALMPGPFYATYAASKSFLLSFSEALFNELRDTGVTVTALMPGATDTEFFARAGMEQTKAGEAAKDDPTQVAKQAFEAMMAGEDHVIAGAMKNKFQGFMAKFLTQQQLADLQREQVKPRH